MPAITGSEIARKAFSLLNVFLPGEDIPANQGELAREAINDLLDAWSQQALFTPIIARERFDLVANQGGPDSRYTIGPGGDFDTERPSNQSSITQANLILTASSPEVRVPLGIYSDDAYDANQIPSMTSGQPTGIYYNPTYQDDLGSIFLWPVPNVATNDLELFLQKTVGSFANLTTTYYVPNGWPLALKYNVADMLQADMGRTLSAAAQRMAISSAGVIKRANVKISDLRSDADLFMAGRQGIYNIQSGTGGGA